MAHARHLMVVAPVFNEEENLRPLYGRLRGALDGLDMEWSLLFVDDGSTDGSRESLRGLHAQDSRVRALLLSRNFGQDAAVTAGLHAAEGDAVVLMDADLQDPPELIPEMVAKWREGYEIVAARRGRRRGEGLLKKATSFAWYRVMDLLVVGGFPKDTGDFRLMDRTVVDAFRQFPQHNRFVRSLIAGTGFRQTFVDFERPPRHAGATKYSFWRSFGLAITGILNSSVAPLRLALWLGLCIMIVATIGIIHWVHAGLTGHTVPGWATLVVSVWFLGGVQCLLIGIVGEYVGRTYLESQRRPLYIVQERLGSEAREEDSTPARRA